MSRSIDRYEAGEVLKKHDDRIARLFTDAEMPGSMNGFAVARDVAKHWPDVEIVVGSGRMSPADGDMPEKATFISKPFSADLVHNHFREKLLDGKEPEPLKQAVWILLASRPRCYPPAAGPLARSADGATSRE